MRKAKGTPFKLRSASPFKRDGDPIKKDLGKKVNDANHLVNVSEERITVPDYSGNPGKVVKASKERCGIEVPMDDPRCVAYSKMSDDEIKASEQKQGLREGYEPPVEGGESVSYQEEDIAQPGGPGDTVDPFTSSEYRVQTRLGKNARNQAIKAQRKRKRNLTDDDFDAINAQRKKDGKKEFKNKRAWFKQQKSDAIKEHTEAQEESTRNRYDQLKQGRNASRSGEQVKYRYDMSKGSEGSDVTIATEDDIKKYGKTSDLPDYSGTPLKYGRKKSATPFKLKKYK